MLLVYIHHVGLPFLLGRFLRWTPGIMIASIAIGTLLGVLFIGRSVAAPAAAGMGVLLVYVGLVPLQELLVARGNGATRSGHITLASSAVLLKNAQNGTRVDALGWDPSKKLIFIPNGGEGNVTVVHQDSPDKYTVVDTVATFMGAKTIAVDAKTHNAYLFQPERGPAPPPAADAPKGKGRGPQGPIVAAWFIVIEQ
jgi:hypothetical protein